MIEEDVSKPVESVEQLLTLHDEDFVHCVYLTVLGRPADPTGFTGYLNLVRQGADRGGILVALATSPGARQLDPQRLPGLKEIVDEARRKRPSFLSKAIFRLLSRVLRP